MRLTILCILFVWGACSLQLHAQPIHIVSTTMPCYAEYSNKESETLVRTYRLTERYKSELKQIRFFSQEKSSHYDQDFIVTLKDNQLSDIFAEKHLLTTRVSQQSIKLPVIEQDYQGRDVGGQDILIERTRLTFWDKGDYIGTFWGVFKTYVNSLVESSNPSFSFDPNFAETHAVIACCLKEKTFDVADLVSRIIAQTALEQVDLNSFYLKAERVKHFDENTRLCIANSPDQSNGNDQYYLTALTPSLRDQSLRLDVIRFDKDFIRHLHRLIVESK